MECAKGPLYQKALKGVIRCPTIGGFVYTPPDMGSKIPMMLKNQNLSSALMHISLTIFARGIIVRQACKA